ncbi:MAG: glycosyltransferase family 9 protein [Alphaproteobacteria bacterium]
MIEKASEVRSILVYTGMELLGDGVMKIPFIRSIRLAFPNARITWMTGHGPTTLKSSLYSLVSKDIAEIIEITRVGYSWKQLFKFPEAWSQRHFDLILDTQSKKVRSLILRKIPHRYFISHAWGWLLSDAKPPKNYQRPPHLVDCLIDMVTFSVGYRPEPSLNIDIPEDYTQQAASLLPEEGRYLGLSPGAGQDKKCWPLENYIEVGKLFGSQGLIPTFILGPREIRWQEEIAKQIPTALFPLQQTTETSPLLTMALARRMAAIVANDSGVGHLLAIGNQPILTLFGPTSAERYAPQTPYGKVLTSHKVGNGRSIATIPVFQVTQALSQMLLVI